MKVRRIHAVRIVRRQSMDKEIKRDGESMKGLVEHVEADGRTSWLLCDGYRGLGESGPDCAGLRSYSQLGDALTEYDRVAASELYAAYLAPVGGLPAREGVEVTLRAVYARTDWENAESDIDEEGWSASAVPCEVDVWELAGGTWEPAAEGLWTGYKCVSDAVKGTCPEAIEGSAVPLDEGRFCGLLGVDDPSEAIGESIAAPSDGIEAMVEECCKGATGEIGARSAEAYLGGVRGRDGAAR